MKKQIFILALVAIVGCCNAQSPVQKQAALRRQSHTLNSSNMSAICKHYLHRDGIEVTYVKNYQLDDIKVPVSMLEAEDSSAFQQLSQELRALPYSHDKSGTRTTEASHFEQLIAKNAKDSVIGSNALEKILGSVQINNLDVSPLLEGIPSSKKNHLTFFRADALSGDKGMYLIYSSSANLTYLVFHPANDKQASQITKTLIEMYANKMKAHTK